MKKYFLTLLAASAISLPAYAQLNIGVNTDANIKADTGIGPSAVGIDSDIGVGSNTGARILDTRSNGQIISGRQQVREKADVRVEDETEYKKKHRKHHRKTHIDNNVGVDVNTKTDARIGY